MEEFAIYLFKSIIWLTGFAVVYFLFLRNERYFTIKRYFLISGIIISFLFPLITIHYQVVKPVPFMDQALSPANFPGSTGIQQDVPGSFIDYRIILLLLYLAGVIFLIFRMILHLGKLVKTINRSEISTQGNAKIVRDTEFPASFSCFSFIFISSSVSNTEAGEIMNHELVHVKQKHWIDLLLAEVMRLLQWINPVAWIYAAFIRQNHEFLADEDALRKTTNPAIYRAALVNQLFSAPVISFSNSFNYSLNKKRFEMMKKIITSPYRKLKLLSVLPVFAIIFYAFARPEYKYVTTGENPLTINQAPVIYQKVVRGVVLKEDGTPFAKVPILVADTKQRVTTDESGKFSIEGISENTLLVFSYKGYLTQALKPEFNKEMTVKLLKDPDYKEPSLREINVIAREKPASGYTLADAIKNQEIPVVIVDGVTTDRKALETLNPNDILSIAILKNESATSVFGDKGKNGVIVVSTKPVPTVIVVDNVISTKSRSEIFSELGDQIVSVKNLSPKEAMEKYGDKGKSGAIEYLTYNKAKELGIKVPFRRRNPEDYPTFQGLSHAVFNDWVLNQLKYPAEATAKGIQGIVDINFTVELDGSVSNIKARGGENPVLAEAVMNVIKSSPRWDPPKNKEVDSPYQTMVSARFSLPDKIDNDVPFVVVEQMPMFPGGDAELLKFIAENTNYPDSAKKAGVQGRVIVRFVINASGDVENAVVLKGVHPLLDAEAVRVVSLLPKFSPGMQGGNPVSVYYMVPITFTLK